ncbi:MAG: hypothetical protein Q8P15_00760 [Nanoarchaeota archaeon]|nr:hypothetical protein [Nanoarchaeota archaeon]
MVDGDYEKILVKISEKSGVNKEELNRRVEAKRTKLSGLISREGAAQVIAAELGISFDNEKIKISELSSNLRKFILVGKVIDVSPVRTFQRDGKESKVANLKIADETSNVKVVLWDDNHIRLIEGGDVGIGKVIEISNASVRGGEIHLGSFSELKITNQLLENVNTSKVFQEKKISDFKPSDNATIRAFVVQVFDPRFFDVCPECKKKAIPEGSGFSCSEHGKIIPEKRALMNFVLDDGTETIRSVLFHDGLSKIGITDLENADSLLKQKQNLLGKEMFFSGNVRINKFFNNQEFIVENADEVDLDGLIAKIENK